MHTDAILTRRDLLRRAGCGAGMLGLAAGIAWIRPDVLPAVQEILQLPDGWMVRTVMALGHPTDAARQPKSPPGEARLPREAVVFRERLPGE